MNVIIVFLNDIYNAKKCLILYEKKNDAVYAANQYLIEEFRPIKNEGAALVGRFVRMGGLEPPLREELDPKSNAATNYATSAKVLLA